MSTLFSNPFNLSPPLSLSPLFPTSENPASPQGAVAAQRAGVLSAAAVRALPGTGPGPVDVPPAQTTLRTCGPGGGERPPPTTTTMFFLAFIPVLYLSQPLFVVAEVQN